MAVVASGTNFRWTRTDAPFPSTDSANQAGLTSVCCLVSAKPSAVSATAFLNPKSRPPRPDLASYSFSPEGSVQTFNLTVSHAQSLGWGSMPYSKHILPMLVYLLQSHLFIKCQSNTDNTHAAPQDLRHPCATTLRSIQGEDTKILPPRITVQYCHGVANCDSAPAQLPTISMLWPIFRCRTQTSPEALFLEHDHKCWTRLTSTDLVLGAIKLNLRDLELETRTVRLQRVDSALLASCRRLWMIRGH